MPRCGYSSPACFRKVGPRKSHTLGGNLAGLSLRVGISPVRAQASSSSLHRNKEMPKYTIGIPTYNRCSLLPNALQAAVRQSIRTTKSWSATMLRRIEHREVVESFGDRVRYHCNETNIGMWPNFARAVELAEGEYFSWLQDDDLIHVDFVRRALESFAKAPDIVFYSGFGFHDHSPTSVHWAPVIGPMFDVDWMGGEVKLMDGFAVAPLLHIINIVTFPMVAFRTDVLRRAVRHVLLDCELFNENMVMAAVLGEGRLAIDPWIARVSLGP